MPQSRYATLVALVFSIFVTRVVWGGAPIDDSVGYAEHQVRIPRIATPQALSADLGAAPWDKAALLTGNIDWRRVRTADLPISTYLCYDAQSLWIAYRSEAVPGKNLKAKVTGRDQELKGDDNVVFQLDVGRDGRIFYTFMMNSNGSFSDSRIGKSSWNSTAEVKAARDDKGWTAVFRIPFSDFQRGEPAVGETWSFNISTRSGTDNCWAPVLGAYHEPERFARLVFGGEKPAARMLAFTSLHAGDNEPRITSTVPLRARVETVEGNGISQVRQEEPVGADGVFHVNLLSDNIHHVNFTLLDPDGGVALSFWRPAEVPPLLSRLPSLREKATYVQASLSRFPEPLRNKIQALLARTTSLISTPGQSVYARWNALFKEAQEVERSLTDAWLYARTLADLSAKADFAVSLATPMDKVMIKDFPCPGRASQSYDLFLAANEHEAMQAVIIPVEKALKGVTVSASPPADNSGTPLDGRIQVSLVGHVKTRPAGSYLPDYVGWYPDPILDFQQSCDAAVGEHVAFWVDAATNKTARPGDYRSTLTLSAEGCEALSVQLNIHVWDIALPEGSHLRNAFTYTEPATKRLYKGKWSNELARRYQDFILDHRLNVDSLYGKEDRDVEMLRRGASRGMNAFNLFYVGKNASADVVSKMLKERVPAIKEAGLYKMAYLYGFDEVGEGTFPKIKEVFGRVHTEYPDLPRATTGYDNTFGRRTGMRDFIDIWIPLVPKFNAIEAERLRSEGKDMWWYICVGPRPPYPNFFVESSTIGGRLLMGTMSYKYRVGGVLYFLTNGWKLVDRPIKSGPYTDWFPGSGKTQDGIYANGDGSIFCAGPDGPVTTMRYENIRDGLEDYEYLYLLADQVRAVSALPPTLERAKFIEQATELLTIPDNVVASSSRFTEDSSQLYAFRRTVAETIINGRTLIPAATTRPASQ